MIDQKLIERYRKGTATPDDLERLNAFLRGKDVSDLESLMHLDWREDANWNAEVSPGETNQAFNELETILNDIKKTKRIRRIGRITSSAAVILLLIGLGFWRYFAAEDNVVFYSTTFGEQEELMLPDGSKVILNANSELRFNREWSDSETRRVWLRGEAYFDVVKKYEEKLKFKVKTEDLDVEVLGTRFVVNNREKGTSVFLEEGAIRLNTNLEVSDTVLMEPGDLVKYSSQEKKITEHQRSDADVYTSWTDQVLTFRSASAAEVLAKMEEIYGVHFKIEDPEILKQSVTTGVPMEDREVAILFIGRALGVEFIEKNDTLHIRGK